MIPAADDPAPQRARSSFYWAMRLMAPDRRAAMFAIYDIARALDDVADEPGEPAAKRAALDGWRQELAATYAGAPTRPLTRALRPAIERFRLPAREFEELIRGLEMDVNGPIQAPTRSELDLYCRRVAGAVGLLSLPVFGADGPEEHEFALHLGRALQLTNILRDLAEDAAISRLYVPREYLETAKLDSAEPSVAVRDPRLGDAARSLAADAEQAFEAARAVLPCCDRRRLWPALAMMAAYRPMLAQMRRANFSPDAPVRPSPGAALVAAVSARVLGRG